MQVKALKNQIYGLEIYKAGDVFEMDDVTAMVKEKHGTVEIVGGGGITPAESDGLDIELADGLPTLDEETSRRKKK